MGLRLTMLVHYLNKKTVEEGTTAMEIPPDYEHLMRHAQDRFPGSKIEVHYTDDEIIHIDVDEHGFTFEIGSDDDSYIFDDGVTSFTIPLLLDGHWDLS